jgi:hypothetical protein
LDLKKSQIEARKTAATAKSLKAEPREKRNGCGVDIYSTCNAGSDAE